MPGVFLQTITGKRHELEVASSAMKVRASLCSRQLPGWAAWLRGAPVAWGAIPPPPRPRTGGRPAGRCRRAAENGARQVQPRAQRQQRPTRRSGGAAAAGRAADSGAPPASPQRPHPARRRGGGRHHHGSGRRTHTIPHPRRCGSSAAAAARALGGGGAARLAARRVAADAGQGGRLTDGHRSPRHHHHPPPPAGCYAWEVSLARSLQAQRFPDLLLSWLYMLRPSRLLLAAALLAASPLAHRLGVGPIYLLCLMLGTMFLNLGRRREGEASAYRWAAGASSTQASMAAPRPPPALAPACAPHRSRCSVLLGCLRLLQCVQRRRPAVARPTRRGRDRPADTSGSDMRGRSGMCCTTPPAAGPGTCLHRTCMASLHCIASPTGL